MSSLGLLLVFSVFVCGSFEEIYTSTENSMSAVSSTREPTTFPLVPEQKTPTSLSPKPIQTTTTTTTTNGNFMKDFPLAVLVCGVLIIACAFFLMTTLLLTCKVCKQSRRIRMLSRSIQLNSDSDFLETKNGKSKPGGEDKETAVLMSYVTQANQEPDSAATEPDGGKAEGDGEKPEDKKEGDSPKSEEALPAAAAAESSTFSQPQEKTAGSETTPAAAAAAPSSSPSSEGTEEPSNQP